MFQGLLTSPVWFASIWKSARLWGEVPLTDSKTSGKFSVKKVRSTLYTGAKCIHGTQRLPHGQGMERRFYRSPRNMFYPLLDLFLFKI